jgi:hypothetical protein
LCREIARAEHALTAPIEATTEWLQRTQRLVTDAEQKLGDLGPLLEAHERRLIADFSTLTGAFRADITADAHHDLNRRLTRRTEVFGPRLRRAAFAEAQEVARAAVTTWLPRARQQSDEQFAECMRRFIDSALSAWREVKASGLADLQELPDLPDIAATLAAPSRFRFNEQLTIAQPASPLRYAADSILGAAGLRRLIIADAHRFLDWLLELNAGRVESDLTERVREARIALDRALRSTLIATRNRTRVWLEHAKKVRDAGAPAVESELARLVSLKQTIASV